MRKSVLWNSLKVMQMDAVLATLDKLIEETQKGIADQKQHIQDVAKTGCRLGDDMYALSILTQALDIQRQMRIEYLKQTKKPGAKPG